MNVNINRVGANLTTAVSVASAALVATKAESRVEMAANNLNVSSVRGEAVDEDVPIEALRRDDALGKLVDGLFDYQAPAMPDFQE